MPSCTTVAPITPGCTDDALIASIIRQLGSGNPCDDTLKDLVPALWELTAAESCGSSRLHLLNAKREAILALMGCEAYSVDSYDFHRQLDGTIKADSVSDIRTQAQSTGNSTRFSLGQGATRYDENSNARSVGTMDRNDVATETGDGTSFYRDDGKGNGFNNSQSTTSILARDETNTINTVVATNQERGARRDCNYEISTGLQDGSGLGILPLVVVGATGSVSEWRKFTTTSASDVDSALRTTKHSTIHAVSDFRDGQGTHDWLSQFLADIFWRDHDLDIKTAKDRTDTRRHQEAHAQGNGDGFSENKDEAHNAAQGTVKSESSSRSTRTARRVDSINAVTLANSQRFRNLQLIYDQITKQIVFEKKRIRMLFRGSNIATLPCCCKSRCCCVPWMREAGLMALNAVGHHASF